MEMITALLTMFQAETPDPYLLPIGEKGQVRVESGWTNTSDGTPSDVSEIAKAAEGYRFVLVGESHDQLAHHEQQAAVIQALVEAGRDVTVGFEMFTRDNQKNLAPWTKGWWSEEEFITNSNWQTQWGFPYEAYKPIFDVVRANELRMTALNLPRDWVRQIGRKGPSVLTEEQRRWAPELWLKSSDHRSFFEAMMGGHPVTGPQMENIYAAQVSWDEGMATSAVDAMSWRVGDKPVMVIIAGSGHVMYDLGISLRLKRKGHDALITTCLNSDGPRMVSRGIASFVFTSPRVEGQ
jgi:uncharacterized iron-regulated protein